MTVDQFPDAHISIEGTSYLYFGGTSYLGIATNPEFQKMLSRSIKTWGTAYGSSRNSNIKLDIYQKAEDVLANISGAEASVTVSSGTLAGKLVIDFLAKKQTGFYHYPKTHPAILKNSSLPLFIEGSLHPKLRDDLKETIVITADAILSAAVMPTNFDFLDGISLCKTIILVIDESHSLGIVGTRGQGIFGTLKHPRISQKIMISSLTKAYGCSGGMIAGDKEFIENIKTDSVFISASGMNPIFLQTFVDAQDTIQRQLQKLRANLNFLFEDMILTNQFKYDLHYPVIYCDSDVIFDYLKSKNIIITNFKYPNYDAVMNRIVVNANHTKEDLEHLKDALVMFQKEVLGQDL